MISCTCGQEGCRNAIYANACRDGILFEVTDYHHIGNTGLVHLNDESILELVNDICALRPGLDDEIIKMLAVGPELPGEYSCQFDSRDNISVMEGGDVVDIGIEYAHCGTAAYVNLSMDDAYGLALRLIQLVSEKKRRIAYKVVRRLGPLMVSCSLVHGSRVVYQPGDWAEAPQKNAEKGYHLTVFRSLEDAENFSRGTGEIWEAEVEGVIEDLPPNPYFTQSRKLTDSHPWPRGTIMAKKVKLLRNLSPTEEV